MATDDHVTGGLIARIRDYLLPRRHTALMLAIITLFAVRSMFGDSSAGLPFFSVVIMFTMIVALYTIRVDELLGNRELLLHQRKRRAATGWVLAGIALALRLIVVMVPSHRFYVAGSFTWLLFFGFVTFTELRGVLRQKEVTRETISMSISVYLLIGITWGVFFIFLFELQPHAFNFGGSPAPTDREIIPVLIYFSLTTLATIGYGDITPLSLQCRYAAVAEGIAGQFYLAILVARLVAINMSESTRAHSADRSDVPGDKEL
jgi:amino acid transporter